MRCVLWKTHSLTGGLNSPGITHPIPPGTTSPVITPRDAESSGQLGFRQSRRPIVLPDHCDDECDE